MRLIVGIVIFLIVIILWPKDQPTYIPPSKYDPFEGLDENERWHVENFWPQTDISLEDAAQAMWDGDDETWLGV